MGVLPRPNTLARPPWLVDLWRAVVEQPDEPHLRLYTADDERLWDSRSRLHAEEFALDEISDEELDAFYAALAEA